MVMIVICQMLSRLGPLTNLNLAWLHLLWHTCSLTHTHVQCKPSVWISLKGRRVSNCVYPRTNTVCKVTWHARELGTTASLCNRECTDSTYIVQTSSYKMMSESVSNLACLYLAPRWFFFFFFWGDRTQTYTPSSDFVVECTGRYDNILSHTCHITL